MKRKPSLKKMINQTTLWFDGDDLRIVLSEKEQIAEKGCKKNCPCDGFFDQNSWHEKNGEWKTSFFGPEAMRANYEFVGFVK